MSPRRVGLAVALALTSACGTYSMVRPAETMPAGRVELSAGLAASQLGEANTVLHAAVAVTDDVEVLAQNEVWNSFAEVRYGVLHEKPNGVSLAVGVGGGRAITLVSAVGDALDSDDADGGAAGLASVAIGKRLDRVDLTVGNRTFYQFGGGFFMSSTRASVRLAITDNVGLLLEGGGTVHAPIDAPDLSIFIGEATTGFWIGF
ncbi:MAG: hypothetical protein JNK64_06550 [Myxococcales bacterium]|nr:hypothetical protein [Myxococcales bacterium]